MKHPISILISAYQTYNYIESCLDSIQNQSYFVNNDNYEILLGIDACDVTLEKVKTIRHKYKNLRVFMMAKNRGTFITMNTLFDIRKYSILRFDSDDIALPNMIERIMDYVPDYDVVRFKFKNFYEPGAKQSIEIPHSQGVLFIKDTTLEKLGGFMPWFCAGDSELIMRIELMNARNECKVKRIDEVLFNRRIHSTSLTTEMSTKAGSSLREHYKYMIKQYNRIPNREVYLDKVVNNYIEV
jgi:glycosyltransferase involved in cell wall biosynthesis